MEKGPPFPAGVLSVTVMVNVYVPVPFDFPEMTPEPLIFNPGGNVPDVFEKWYGVVIPPVTVSACE